MASSSRDDTEQAADSLAVALARIEEAHRNEEPLLDLFGLRLTQLPASIEKLTQLQSLNLSGNQSRS